MPTDSLTSSNNIRYMRKYENFLFYYASWSNAKDIIMHSHEHVEILLLEKGDVSYNVEGRCYHLTKNCLVITRPFERHNLIFNSPAEYIRYVFLFDEKKMAADTYEKIPSNVDVINFDSNALVCGLFQKLNYYLDNLEEDEMEQVLIHTIQEILYNIRLAAHTRYPKDMITNPLIHGAVSYIDANILTSLRIDDVCRELHITKAYLHQLFVKHLDITPGKYIISKKLTIAQKELRKGIKATDVYLYCGFTDYSTFYRHYKKLFGHAPSEEINSSIVCEIYS